MDSLDLHMLDLTDDKLAESTFAQTKPLNEVKSDLHMLDLTNDKLTESTFAQTKPLNKVKSENNNDYVRSTAVVTYTTAKYPALFSQLAPFTNLNLAPSNWLRNAPGLRPSFIFSRRRSSMFSANDTSLFSSFQMANSHLSFLGDVDVVSDAENLKKLLKAPYSKAHVSMAVHRFGNTILLEQFDINHESLKPHGWKWFKDMYKQLTQKGILKKKLPSAQHERLMLSKFLYYSLRSRNVKESADADCLDTADVMTIDEMSPSAQCQCSHSSDDPVELAQVRMSKVTEENSLIPAELRWRYWTPDDAGTSQCFDIRHTFERTIFWTFEDLQMLLGTNMPIFGGGEYPAVSLRLLDSNKPINILTGIDYWLDNLICNVPEVVMCFHVNGIVQKYEVIKTEEIPKITAPKFSPQVIKDIAQNILSFLKSKCTKEGHTYWLFKGSNDDVVKLYDLTSLCNVQESADTEQKNDAQNPFIISVATLLYKMAVSLMKEQKTSSTDQSSTITIKKLLHNCVMLLKRQDQLAPVMLDAALCMLSTLYLPDPTEEIEVVLANNIKLHLHTNSISKLSEKHIHACSKNVLDSAEIAVISSVTDLSIPEKFKSDACASDTINDSVEEHDNYLIALSYIVEGLEIFNQFNSKKNGNPFKVKCKELLFVHMQMIRNITLIYYALAKHAYISQSYGKSLQCIKVALLSYEYLEQLVDVQSLHETNGAAENSSCTNDFDVLSVLQGTTPPEYNLLLSRLLSLCGDIQMLQCQWSVEQKQALQIEYEEFCETDSAINKALEKNFSGVGEKYQTAIQLSNQYQIILDACRVCFETALDNLKFNRLIAAKAKPSSRSRAKEQSKKGKDVSKPTQNEASLQFSLIRKLGHVVNEQGAMQLDAAIKLLTSSDNTCDCLAKARETWKLSYDYFETALKCFVDVGDNTNQALVLSNLGRLMRVCAQSTAQNENEKFTLHEQQLYDSAIEYYKRAIALQKQTQKNRKTACSNSDKLSPSISDNLSWELSVAYFTLAQRLQDQPPLNMKPRDEIEKIILDLLSKSLKCCVDIWKKTVKRPLALHHCAKIHARLASLYHNSSRDNKDNNKKRQLRNLAEVQYEKSCLIFANLADPHMCEYFRVNLEWLALKEQQLPFITNQSTKIKFIKESFKVMLSCAHPLKVLIVSLKECTETLQNPESSPVDPQKPWDRLGIGSLKEWNALSLVLATIFKSFVLTFLKLTASASNIVANSSSKKKLQSSEILSLDHANFKQIYSKSLRLLQNSEAGAESEHGFLLKRAEALMEIIKDIQ